MAESSKNFHAIILNIYVSRFQHTKNAVSLEIMSMLITLISIFSSKRDRLVAINSDGTTFVAVHAMTMEPWHHIVPIVHKLLSKYITGSTRLDSDSTDTFAWEVCT